MSYILEALKRSDTERQYSKTSHPLADLSPLAHRKKNGRSLLMSIGLALLLVGTTAISTFWYFKQLPAANQVVLDMPTATPPAPEPPIVQAEQQQEAQYVIEPTPLKTLPPTDDFVVISTPPSTQTPRKIPSNAPQLSELPIEVQNEIPALNFAGHAYAESPASRLIIINDKIVREGDSIDNQLILKEITFEGVVLSYKTILFQIILPQ